MSSARVIFRCSYCETNFDSTQIHIEVIQFRDDDTKYLVVVCPLCEDSEDVQLLCTRQLVTICWHCDNWKTCSGIESGKLKCESYEKLTQEPPQP
ncbi:MAG: hypothetical protein FWE56_04550 [Candidatus Bathyarchaeota archaeon]|nr:hypothetical protein [Candidatus Termiticorpusculum sp.]MCL2868825.1 hypothetical protein [Candidatus Termiticorpusculum sp.]